MVNRQEILTVMLVALSTTATAQHRTIIDVAARDYDREQSTPICAPVPPHFKLPDRPRLRCLDNGALVPAQLTTESPPRLWWMLRTPLGRGENQCYEIDAAPQQNVLQSGVQVRDDGRRLLVSVNGRPVLHYNHALFPSPYPDKTFYARSGFIHPVFSPKGHVVTDGMPVNHTHQHGIMFAWRKTSFEGREIDFWNSETGLGRVEHLSVDRTFDGPVIGGFTVTLRHVDLTAADGNMPVIRETWQVRVFARQDPFIWELRSTQTTTGDTPLTINQFHYGGMMIRGSSQWSDPRDCEFSTNLGDDRDSGNHTRPRWVAMYGPFDGSPAGTTVLSHPANFRAPQHVRLHPSLPYFCFAPMVSGEFQLTSDKPYRSAYRFVVHDGPPDALAADGWWQDYANPQAAFIDSQER